MATLTEPLRLTARPRSPAGDVLELADGVELIGEFEDSGFKEPPLLAQRADGQVVQLSRLLYLVAGACDGRRDADAVAAVVSERYGRTVSGENVRFLADEQLRPPGRSRARPSWRAPCRSRRPPESGAPRCRRQRAHHERPSREQARRSRR